MPLTNGQLERLLRERERFRLLASMQPGSVAERTGFFSPTFGSATPGGLESELSSFPESGLEAEFGLLERAFG